MKSSRSMSRRQFLKGAPARDEWRAIRAMLIEKGGVRGDIEVLDTLGNTRTDLRMYVFDSGPALLAGVGWRLCRASCWSSAST